MKYQLLSYKTKEENEKIDESVIHLLKQIYSMKEGKLLKNNFVLQQSIWKDKQGKTCFAIESNMKEHQFKTMLTKTYGNDAIKDIEEVPVPNSDGKVIVAQNKLYALNMQDVLSRLVTHIPKHCMMTLRFSKAVEPIQFMMRTEEKQVIKQSKVNRNSIAKEKEKELRSRILNDTYFFEVDIVISSLNEAGKKALANFGKNIRFLTEGQFNFLRAKFFSRTSIGKKVQMHHQSKLILTLDETKYFMLYPTQEEVQDKVYLAREEINEDLYKEGLLFGTHTRQAGVKIPIRLLLKQLTKHGVITGATGGGKSAALLTVLDDFVLTYNMEYGYTIFDPKEETLLKIINHLQYFESIGYTINWEKVHYIDLADPEYVPGLNLLNIPTKKKDVDKFQENLMELFNAVYRVGDTPNLDKMLRNTVGTLLLEKGRQNTIVDAQRLLDDEKRQKQAQSNLGNGYYERMYKSFWDDPPKKSDLASIKNRLNMFQTPQMQRLYGLPEFGLKIRKWMDEGHIVLINTKGLDEQKTRLNVGHLLAQYTMVAMERPTTGAKEHPIIFDEGKQMQLPIIEDKMIPLLRGFGIPIIFCTQTIVSVKKSLADEISENVQTIISGRLGAEGAVKLSKMMNGRVPSEAFQNLADRHLLLSTQNKLGKFETIEIEVQPPYWYYKKEDGTWKIAEYANEELREKEESFAGYLATKKIEEIQKRDWKHKDEVDRLLNERYPDAEQYHAINAQKTDSNNTTFFDIDNL